MLGQARCDAVPDGVRLRVTVQQQERRAGTTDDGVDGDGRVDVDLQGAKMGEQVCNGVSLMISLLA